MDLQKWINERNHRLMQQRLRERAWDDAKLFLAILFVVAAHVYIMNHGGY